MFFPMDAADELKNRVCFSSKVPAGTSESLLFSWIRPRSYWDVVGTHLPFAFVTGILLLLSKWVPRGIMPLRKCTFLQLTGYPCPFCGFTRSVWAMGGGNWDFAIYNCPLACLLYITAALVFAWNITGLMLGIQIVRGRLLRLSRHQVRWGICVLALLFLLNWGYRLVLGLK